MSRVILATRAGELEVWWQDLTIPRWVASVEDAIMVPSSLTGV